MACMVSQFVTVVRLTTVRKFSINRHLRVRRLLVNFNPWGSSSSYQRVAQRGCTGEGVSVCGAVSGSSASDERGTVLINLIMVHLRIVGLSEL